jgi:hypothetical protein
MSRYITGMIMIFSCEGAKLFMKIISVVIIITIMMLHIVHRHEV